MDARRRFAATFVVTITAGIAVVLAGLAGTVTTAVTTTAQAASSGEPIDESYRVLAHDGRTEVDPYQLYVFIKATNEADKLRVCGSYVAEMSDQRFQEVLRMLRHPSSYLRIGAVDKDAYHVRTGFLPGTRSLPVEQTPLRDRLPYVRMHAGCMDTDAPWHDSYATEEPAMTLYDVKSRPAIFGPGRRF
jgi:hypothetical protein